MWDKTRKSPTWHQNRASSKKQNLDLYSSCSRPAHDSGPSPTQRWPSKKLGKAGQWLPSGQCMELRKVSLQDTGENSRAKALGSPTWPSPAPCALGPDRNPAAGAASQAESWQGDGSQAGLWGGTSKRCPRGTCGVLRRPPTELFRGDGEETTHSLWPGCSDCSRPFPRMKEPALCAPGRAR